MTNADWNPQTIKVESIIGRYPYLDPKTLILDNRPTAVRNRLRRVNKGLGDPTPTKSPASVGLPGLSGCDEMSAEPSNMGKSTQITHEIRLFTLNNHL